MTVEHTRITYKSEDLISGFIGKSCSFEFRGYENMSPTGRARFDKLRKHLAANGLLNPLITYKGHVLIGMRRFEILKDTQAEFDCVEITEEVENWTSQDITRFQNFKTKLNGNVDAC